MSDEKASPIESDESSIAFDESARVITLEQKPGEQPVTVAGAPHGPDTESVDGKENVAVPPSGSSSDQ
jgi:hypothetical protein